MAKTKVKENPKANFEIPGSQLYVTKLSVLFKFFKENKVSPSKKKLKRRIYFFSIISTPLQWIQRLVLSFTINKIDLSKKPPVFILGHWRSGTTHIHYTLAKDKRFSYLNNFQSFFFNICMLGIGWLDKVLAPLMPGMRPMDNMKSSLFSPQEEENALSNITYAAGVNSFYFPKNRSYFYKYNLFEGISDKEYKEWQKSYVYLLKVLTKIRKGKRLLLKNPNNTGRVKELLELFPNAKFVYIHRNPYKVYLSTKHLHRTVLRGQSLQVISSEEEDDIIIDNYKKIIQRYIDLKHLIPEGNLKEIAFDTINDLSTFENIYQTLGLGDWENLKPTIKEYLDSKKNYKKNKFVPLDEKLVERIKEEWGFAFEEYGYSTNYEDTFK